MGEVSEIQKALVEESTYLRGLILRSYSQVEFLLADMSVKLDLKFPYLIKKRINAARRIAERSGFESYKDDLNQVCDDLLMHDEMRNMMAHGFLMLAMDKSGNHEFELRMYQRELGSDFKLIKKKTNITVLRIQAREITRYCAAAVKLFQRMYLEQRIEDPRVGFLIEPKI